VVERLTQHSVLIAAERGIEDALPALKDFGRSAGLGDKFEVVAGKPYWGKDSWDADIQIQKITGVWNG
jgi:hypothetical protein